MESSTRSGVGSSANPHSARPDAGRIVMVNYRGRPPTDDEIRSALALDMTNRYLFIVSTAALESRRQGLACPDQRGDADRSGRDRFQMVFHKLLRHLLRRPLLTRAEERVALQRA